MCIPLAGSKDSNWPPSLQGLNPKEPVTERYSFSLQHQCFQKFFSIRAAKKGLQTAKMIEKAAPAGQSLTCI